MAGLSSVQQRQRRLELDRLRIERGLTDAEKAEADMLHERLYQRQLRLAA